MAAEAESHHLPLLLHVEPPPRSRSSSSSRSRPGPSSPSSAPLSDRLRRLWTERGDFSKFSLDQLGSKTEVQSQDTIQQQEDRLVIGWGVSGQAFEHGKVASEGDSKTEKTHDIDTSPMTMDEFLQLKEDIMGRLQVAKQSLYSSQALVSLLVASNKPRGGAAQQHALALHGNSVAATRHASAVPSGAQSPALSTASGAAAVGAEKRLPAGSAAAVEAEFGLDPYSVALTSIERLDLQAQIRQEQSQQQGSDRFKSEQGPDSENKEEVAEYIDGRLLALAHKRQSMANAIKILRAGAKRMGGGDAASADEVKGEPNDIVDPLVSQAGRNADFSTRRWRALRQAQSSGWGITPGRPGRTAFDAKMRLDEGEQDAWIGFGIPEAKPQYRRTALAYLRHRAPANGEGESSTSEGKGSDIDMLLFTSRIRRRLRLQLVSKAKQKGDEDTVLVSHPLQEEYQDSGINQSLRSAQAELAERELFDEIASEARVLSAQNVVPCHNTDQSVTLSIDAKLQLIFEMVDSKNLVGGAVEQLQADEDQTTIPGHTDQSAGTKMPPQSGLTRSNVETATKVPGDGSRALSDGGQQSALLSLILSYLKVSLIRIYRTRSQSEALKQSKGAVGSALGKSVTSPPMMMTTTTGGMTAEAVVKEGAPSTKSRPIPSIGPEASNKGARPTSYAAPVKDLWDQSPILLPLLALLHYSSFTRRLEDLLSSSVISQQQQQQQGRNIVTCWYQFDAFESLISPSKWMVNLLTGDSHQVREGMRSLSGSGTLYIGQRRGDQGSQQQQQQERLHRGRCADDSDGGGKVVMSLTCRYPDEVCVALPFKRKVDGSLGVFLSGIGLDDLDEILSEILGEMEI